LTDHQSVSRSQKGRSASRSPKLLC
jgi:hypothetical protein